MSESGKGVARAVVGRRLQGGGGVQPLEALAPPLRAPPGPLHPATDRPSDGGGPAPSPLSRSLALSASLNQVERPTQSLTAQSHTLGACCAAWCLAQQIHVDRHHEFLPVRQLAGQLLRRRQRPTTTTRRRRRPVGVGRRGRRARGRRLAATAAGLLRQQLGLRGGRGGRGRAASGGGQLLLAAAGVAAPLRAVRAGRRRPHPPAPAAGWLGGRLQPAAGRGRRPPAPLGGHGHVARRAHPALGHPRQLGLQVRRLDGLVAAGPQHQFRQHPRPPGQPQSRRPGGRGRRRSRRPPELGLLHRLQQQLGRIVRQGPAPHLPLDEARPPRNKHSERQRRDKEAADVVHALPDAGAGEGVPLQPLPDAAATHRDCACAVPDGTTNQDLVPEQADEVEKGAQDGQYEYRSVPNAGPLPAPLPPPPGALCTLPGRHALLTAGLQPVLGPAGAATAATNCILDKQKNTRTTKNHS